MNKKSTLWHRRCCCKGGAAPRARARLSPACCLQGRGPRAFARSRGGCSDAEQLGIRFGLRCKQAWRPSALQVAEWQGCRRPPQPQNAAPRSTYANCAWVLRGDESRPSVMPRRPRATRHTVPRAAKCACGQGAPREPCPATAWGLLLPPLLGCGGPRGHPWCGAAAPCSATTATCTPHANSASRVTVTAGRKGTDHAASAAASAHDTKGTCIRRAGTPVRKRGPCQRNTPSPHARSGTDKARMRPCRGTHRLTRRTRAPAAR